MHILAILFPVFSIVLLGYLYARKYRPTLSDVNKAMLWVFVPALVFDVMSDKEFYIIEYQWLALAGLIVVLGSGLLAWPVAKLLRYPIDGFMPPMMFNNCGNLGLPLAILAFGQDGLEGAVVLFLVSNLLHFTLGTWIFGGIVSWKGLVLNPVNIATFAGLAVNFARIDIPAFILSPINMLGQIVIPLMLFSLGVRMLDVRKSQLKTGLIGGVVRPLVGLASAIIAAWLIPLGDFQFGLLLIFSALPPAVLNFLFAEQYLKDSTLVASLVLVGNAISAVVMAIILWWVL